MSKNLYANPRVTQHNRLPIKHDGQIVIYWMQRAQRITNNHALNLAIEQANALHLPLVVYFALDPAFTSGNLRHLHFMLQGLDEVASKAKDLKIPFILDVTPPVSGLTKFSNQQNPALIVGDENPLNYAMQWRKDLAVTLSCSFVTVDADVVVPTSLFFKEEYSAYTMRRKIKQWIPSFLQPMKDVVPVFQDKLAELLQKRHVHRPSALADQLDVDSSVAPVVQFIGGTSQATKRFRRFMKETFAKYSHLRNKPEAEGTTRISPYLHFGQVSVQQLAYDIQTTTGLVEAKEALLEQLIVRREVAINYVTHNPLYDSLKGCHEWAQKSLNKHMSDLRPIVYLYEDFEQANTHDPLWNAAQVQMVTEGWMHGYMRMYWAKKILEWTETPQEAFHIAITLNDKYQLDGRDPNGYTGVAWAIGGKHDRPWGPERQIFGLVRYMSYESTRRKFKSKLYIQQYS